MRQILAKDLLLSFIILKEKVSEKEIKSWEFCSGHAYRVWFGWKLSLFDKYPKFQSFLKELNRLISKDEETIAEYQHRCSSNFILYQHLCSSNFILYQHLCSSNFILYQHLCSSNFILYQHICSSNFICINTFALVIVILFCINIFALVILF